MLRDFNNLNRNILTHRKRNIGRHSHLRIAELTRILRIIRTRHLQRTHDRMRVIRRCLHARFDNANIHIEESFFMSGKPTGLDG